MWACQMLRLDDLRLLWHLQESESLKILEDVYVYQARVNGQWSWDIFRVPNLKMKETEPL